MDKLVRRTVLAKGQAIRRAKIRTQRKQLEDRLLSRLHKKDRQDAKYKMLEKARVAKREDWELGPLAPRRDVGEDQETYGTLPAELMRCRDVPEKLRMRWKFALGDRVVLLEGRDKGKIGEIVEINHETETIVVQGLNLVSQMMPRLPIFTLDQTCLAWE